MERRELVSFFSEFWKIDSSQINDEMELNDQILKNQSSIRFYQFIAALESNYNVKVQNLNKILTFGDLINNLELSRWSEDDGEV